MTPLSSPIAPDQPSELVEQADLSSAQGPVDIAHREPVGPIRDTPRWRTLSAGDEIPVPLVFDVPNRLRNIFARLGRSGHRTTLLAPELQSDIDPADATVMAAKGMSTPYVVRDSGPWYDSFLVTVGPR